jgi:hypothetical protein
MHLLEKNVVLRKKQPVFAAAPDCRLEVQLMNNNV